jgi:DNA-binding Xre family transcriptional regulator
MQSILYASFLPVSRMLKFNVKRVLDLRGVERPYSYLIKLGLTHITASNMANGKLKSPKTEQIELLCRVLKCSPNDLYEWTAETGANAISKSHPLNALRHERKKGVGDALRHIPLERLGEVEEFLKGMKEET